MRNGQSIWRQSNLSLITGTEFLDLELLFLQFLRSRRKQKYISHSQSLTKIIPWMFALDHYHFSQSVTYQNHSMDVRTRPLSLRSLAHSSCQHLISLENNSPLTHAEFFTGSDTEN